MPHVTREGYFSVRCPITSQNAKVLTLCGFLREVGSVFTGS